MTTSSAEVAHLVDSSVAVPLCSQDHPDHAAMWTAVGARTLGLAGHAAFETYSVLSRLHAPLRISPPTILEMFRLTFPATVHLGSERSTALLAELPARGIAGGAVFDALVGAAAVEHGMTLLTRDRRARGTYAALGVTVEYIGS